jgi:excisionase family DNA binding protein
MTALPISTDRVTLTVDEAAQLLGISRTLAFQAVRNGDIPAIRIRRRILVPVAQLNDLLLGSASANRPTVEAAAPSRPGPLRRRSPTNARSDPSS